MKNNSGNNSTDESNSKSAKRLSSFGGVFTPSILTILGVIMYLRFGWVVGHAGIWGTLIIVTLSTAITFLTGLSISAIATNQKVKTGGAYYIISRSLGIEPGGAVGIPLYFAQALSVALYTIGFAESLVNVFPSLNLTGVALITTVLVAGLAISSAQIAIRAQYIILGAIALSLISFAFGSPVESTEPEMWGVSESSDLAIPFWTVFAVFFPAVTGIMSGVNMSGDLKDPVKAIPRGTLSAIGVGYLVYMALPILLVLRADAATLVSNTMIMRDIAFWGDAILLGVWGATLSSAVGSIMGAPRVLQALARDKLLPRWLSWLGKGAKKSDEPKIGTVFTLCIVLVAVYLGNLNIIAPILTMFFLTTYGVLNLAAGLEQLLKSPSYRPSFYVPWYLSLIGFLGCIGVMFLINILATLVALIVVAAIYLWFHRQKLNSPWGDIRSGIWMSLAETSLRRLRTTPDPKNWRPHILVLSGSPRHRWPLIEIASSITHERNIMTVASIVSKEDMDAEKINDAEHAMRKYLEKHQIRSFVRVLPASDPFKGMTQLVGSYGLGSYVPNIILLGFSDNMESLSGYLEMINYFRRMDRNIILVRPGNQNHDKIEHRTYSNSRIDVWWGGLNNNGSLMVILAHLIRSSRRWPGAEVNIHMLVNNPEAKDKVQANLEKMISGFRIKANMYVRTFDGYKFEEILHDTSSEADLVLLGLKKPEMGSSYEQYYDRIKELSEPLPTTLFVHASENMPFEEVLISEE